MKSILAKLHTIMGEVDYIQKDKTNSFHRYNYASEQAIKERLHTELVKNGVLFTLSADGFTNTPVKTAKGNDEMLVTIQLSYAFLDVESGEKLEGKFIGSGQDSGDKGAYKAITGAIKYILTSTFLIPTGDDPENDDTSPKPHSAAKKPTGQNLAPHDLDNTPPPIDPEYDQSGNGGGVEEKLSEGDQCPACGLSVMKIRKGPKGQFLGCGAFPNCKHTAQI